MTLHTDIPTRSALERLLDARGEPCVSIYLATSPIPKDAQRARIALKNLAADAAGQLERVETERGVVPELRDALDDLVEDDDYWNEQARSLAIFASPGAVRTFRLPNRLRDAVEVGDRFYVKPLLRAVTFPQAGFVLALAAGSVRLVEVALSAGAGAAHLVDYAREIDEGWLEGVGTIGVTSGASVPEVLVRGVLEHLAERGWGAVEEITTAEESLVFSLPRELRPSRSRS